MRKALRIIVLSLFLGSLIAGLSLFPNTKAVSASSTPTLVGYWKMDEMSWNGSIDEVKDSSGYNNHGQARDGAQIVRGKFGHAGKFTPGIPPFSSSAVGVLYSPSLDLPRLTISFWVKANSYSGNAPRLISLPVLYELLLSNSSGEEGALEWRVRPQQEWKWVGVKTQSGKLPLNRWQYVTVSYDGSLLKIYLNGTKVVEGSAPGQIPSNVNEVNLGLGNMAAGYYSSDVLLDEVRLYREALSDHEVVHLYKSYL